jgi:hypothetical protein
VGAGALAPQTAALCRRQSPNHLFELQEEAAAAPEEPKKKSSSRRAGTVKVGASAQTPQTAALFRRQSHPTTCLNCRRRLLLPLRSPRRASSQSRYACVHCLLPVTALAQSLTCCHCCHCPQIGFDFTRYFGFPFCQDNPAATEAAAPSNIADEVRTHMRQHAPTHKQEQLCSLA